MFRNLKAHLVHSIESLCYSMFQVSQYIGEVARYLINTPPTPYEKEQKVRMMFGNGMRADIFDQIRSRFNVDIAEFYGATEGNCSLSE